CHLGLRENLPGISVELYEKNDNVGGTWAKNTYPGLSCDIPSKLYSYSFAPNPDWSATYASQPEILSNIQQVVRSFDCSDYIPLTQECVAAEWPDDELHWRVKLIDLESGQSYLRYTKILVTAVRFCDAPKGADKINGIENFTRKVFHSARWDHSFDFSDKNVAVVGNGCSANQFIPSLLDQGHRA
ncbi:hypothetical protein EDB80DRAFT_595589, partial [Ilyonectria destructans]